VLEYGTFGSLSPEDFEMIPDADRFSGSMAYYSTTQLDTTEFDPTNSTAPKGVSDQMLWHGQLWRVLDESIRVFAANKPLSASGWRDAWFCRCGSLTFHVFHVFHNLSDQFIDGCVKTDPFRSRIA
jgi:hypothetical protein